MTSLHFFHYFHQQESDGLVEVLPLLLTRPFHSFSGDLLLLLFPDIAKLQIKMSQLKV